jgi:hypothetical protein
MVRWVFAWLVSATALAVGLPIAPPQAAAEVTIVAAADVSLGASPARARLWLANGNPVAESLRIRSPHVAHLDARTRTFVPVKQMPALEVQLDRLTHVVQSGAKQDVNLTLRQTGSIPAGRYKLMLTAERQATHEAVAYGAMFFTVPPMIAVGQPQMVAVDERSDRRFVKATVRFSVTANVRAMKVAVASGDLQREDAGVTRLPLDIDSGVSLSPRGEVRPQRVRLGYASRSPSVSEMRQTRWAELVADDEAGVDTDVFVEVRWRKPDGAPLPSGQYTGQVRLIVMPMDQP